MSNLPVINARYRSAIEAHIAGNLVIRNTESPLILGVFGPPGEGKTFQLDYICRDLGLHQIIISPGELENEHAGRPAEILREAYLKAGDTNLRVPSVLVINDIDTVLGDWGELVQYTTNRQLVYGQLQSFCDFPNLVLDTTVRRTPIIITGNNPSILYRPLLRPGRMRLVEWVPSFDEKVAIVSGIFPSISLVTMKGLVSEYSERSIAFWADVAATCWEISVSKWLLRENVRSLRDILADGTQFDFNNSALAEDVIRDTASRLSRSRVADMSYAPGVVRSLMEGA